MIKPRFFIPGPTSVPEAVAFAAARQPLHHRGEEFAAMFLRVQSMLRDVFCTRQPVVTLASSGTGAAEAVMTNLFSPGDRGIYINNGRFAARWGDMMRSFGMNAIEIPVEWGSAVDPARVEEALIRYPDARCVWAVHSETSTGVRADIQSIAAITQQSQALLCVDAVTSLAAEECRTDDWGLDVVISASQKALMSPPGLSFIAMSERARQAAQQARIPHYYFDLIREQERIEEGTTRWTPPVTLIAALESALQMITEEGLEHTWQRHTRMALALRSGLQALRLMPFGSPPSNAVTVAHLPATGRSFRTLLRKKYRVTVASGQDDLKDKVFRISHMGYCDEGDILALLSAIERALRDTGITVTPGSSLYAAQEQLCT